MPCDLLEELIGKPDDGCHGYYSAPEYDDQPTAEQLSHEKYEAERFGPAPTPEEIKELAREIREVGFVDQQGEWHPPWSHDEYVVRLHTSTPKYRS